MSKNNTLRYIDINICLQEIPNEISLTFSITGCNLRCEGCHSPYLWKESNGHELTDEIFINNLIKYKNIASNVLFMGGEWKYNDLLNKIRIAIKYGYNTALYTGLNINDVNDNILKELTYIKTGRYIKTLGGLDNINTNQNLTNLKTGEKLNKYFIKYEKIDNK